MKFKKSVFGMLVLSSVSAVQAFAWDMQALEYQMIKRGERQEVERVESERQASLRKTTLLRTITPNLKAPRSNQACDQVGANYIEATVVEGYDIDGNGKVLQSSDDVIASVYSTCVVKKVEHRGFVSFNCTVGSSQEWVGTDQNGNGKIEAAEYQPVGNSKCVARTFFNQKNVDWAGKL